MTTPAIDLAAASRISRRVELRTIRLVEIHGTWHAPSTGKRLIPDYEQECVPTKVEPGVIEVTCTYKFNAKSADVLLADATLSYVVAYSLLGDEEPEQADIEHFARANGAYHSWPFVRESIFSLTSRMGFPPYTLPVLSFLPKPQPKPEKDTDTDAGADNPSGEIAEAGR